MNSVSDWLKTLKQSGTRFLIGINLRIVQTQAILFLKSMSERVESDIERPAEIEFLDQVKSIKDGVIKIQSRPDTCRIRLFPILIFIKDACA